MKFVLRTCVILTAVVLFYAGAARAQGFPDGPGKEIVQAACSVCHETELITNARRSKAEWTETVQDMVSRGAPLVEGEREIVIEYLAKNFGPDKAENDTDKVEDKARRRTPEPQPNPNRPDKKNPPVLSASAKSKLLVANR
jgi:hypothetical protein